MQGPRNDNAARRKRVYVQSCIIVISASTQADVHYLRQRYHARPFRERPLFPFPPASIPDRHSVIPRDFDDRFAILSRPTTFAWIIRWIPLDFFQISPSTMLIQCHKTAWKYLCTISQWRLWNKSSEIVRPDRTTSARKFATVQTV